MLNEIKVKLEENRYEFIRFIEMLNENDLNQSLETGWSISEVVEHVCMTETNVTKGIRYYASQPDEQPTVEKPIHLVLDRTKKIDAPNNVRPTGQRYTKEEHLQNLTSSRSKLLQTLEDLDENVFTLRSFPHVVFGPLTLLQWVEVLAYHDIRHLGQMKEILNRDRK